MKNIVSPEVVSKKDTVVNMEMKELKHFHFQEGLFLSTKIKSSE